MITEKGMRHYEHRKSNIEHSVRKTINARGVWQIISCHSTNGFELGERSFPKLKIPHQSHADFCSTDTAGGLDNKKRRYAPRGGVAYRLFLWGFPKGATPHLAHDFAKQSVVCYTLCRRCRENAVAAGEGKGI